jgi:hypothetical protein
MPGVSIQYQPGMCGFSFVHVNIFVPPILWSSQNRVELNGSEDNAVIGVLSKTVRWRYSQKGVGETVHN